MKIFFSSILLFLSFSACSVYKSEGRKALESTGPSYYGIKVSAAAVIIAPSAMTDYLKSRSEKSLFSLCEKKPNNEDLSCRQSLNCTESSSEDLAIIQQSVPFQILEQASLLSTLQNEDFKKPLLCSFSRL